MQSGVPLDVWWDCTCLTPDTREIFVTALPNKVAVLFYSENPEHPGQAMVIVRPTDPVPRHGSHYILWG
jgi:hypothetical protein